MHASVEQEVPENFGRAEHNQRVGPDSHNVNDLGQVSDWFQQGVHVIGFGAGVLQYPLDVPQCVLQPGRKLEGRGDVHGYGDTWSRRTGELLQVIECHDIVSR
jgi:hypothetical protein